MNPTFTLKGRVDVVEMHEGKYFTVITTPAPDPYTKPSRYKLRSPRQLGAVGSEVTLDVTISGTVFEKSIRDKNTGMPRVFNEASVYLDADYANINRQSPPAVKSA